MVESASQLVDKLSKRFPSSATVVEIASNDGYLLQHYLKKNMKVFTETMLKIVHYPKSKLKR